MPSFTTPPSRRAISILFLLLSCLVLSAQAAYKQIYSPQPGDAMPVYIYQLDNGLSIYLSPNKQEPRFYSEIAVRAGSKNDPPQTTGLAHYLEHMLFKGSQHLGTLDYAAEKPHLDRIRDLYEEHRKETDPKKRAAIYQQINKENQLDAQYAVPNEIDKVYDIFGGQDLNAHTSNEETVFQVNLPINRLKQWAALESDRFETPVLRLFVTELEAVYEEKNRSMDDKDNVLDEAVLAQLWKNHPYGQYTTLGRPEHLKNPSIVNIEKFYHTNYVPGNMGVFLSGDFDPNQVMPMIDDYFSAWKEAPLPAQKQWPEQPLKGVERVVVNYPDEEKVQLAFRTAPEKSEDKEALMMLDMVLDNEVAGLINLNLNQAQKVREAGSYPMIMNDYGAEFLWGIPKKGQSLQEVEQLLLDQITLIKKGQFGDWLAPAVLNDFEKSRKRSIEDNSGRVDWMRQSFIAHEDWPFASHELDRMRKVTKADIVRVANEYFSDGYVAGYREEEPRQVPFIEKPKIEKVNIDPHRESQFAKKLLAMPAPEVKPVWVDPNKDYQIQDDGLGMKYYSNANPINDLFTLTIRIEKGSRQDRTLPAGIQLLQKAGTPWMSGAELKKDWYRLGTDFTISTDENETVIQLSGLQRNLLPSMQLLSDLLYSPVTDQATWNQLVEIILAQREDAKKDQKTLLSALTLYNRYGNESRYRQMLPTEQLRALKANDLLTSVSHLMDLKRTVLFTGKMPFGEFTRQFNYLFNDGARLQTPPPHVYLPARSTPKNEIDFYDKQLAQAEIRVEFADGIYNEAEVPAVELFDNYFDGGMGGVVFQELRESRALAYSVDGVYEQPEWKKDQNLMIGVIDCQPDKTIDAVQGMAGLMDQLPLSQDRFDQAEGALINQYRFARITFREVLDAVLGWQRLGLNVDPRAQWFAQVKSLKMADLARFDKNHVAAHPKLISIVGDSQKMDMKRLAQFGEIHKVGTDDLFVK